MDNNSYVINWLVAYIASYLMKIGVVIEVF